MTIPSSSGRTGVVGALIAAIGIICSSGLLPGRNVVLMERSRALEEDLLPGRTIEAIATAALYAAARQMNTPRSLGEVSAVSRVDEMEFKRAYRYIVRELGLAVQPASPQHYVDRLTSTLDVDAETEQLARELLETADGTGKFNGKSPIGLAAAAIYAAARLTGRKLTQDDVGEVADVSNVTIRNRYQELVEQYEESRS